MIIFYSLLLRISSLRCGIPRCGERRCPHEDSNPDLNLFAKLSSQACSILSVFILSRELARRKVAFCPLNYRSMVCDVRKI